MILLDNNNIQFQGVKTFVLRIFMRAIESRKSNKTPFFLPALRAILLAFQMPLVFQHQDKLDKFFPALRASSVHYMGSSCLHPNAKNKRSVDTCSQILSTQLTHKCVVEWQAASTAWSVCEKSRSVRNIYWIDKGCTTSSCVMMTKLMI